MGALRSQVSKLEAKRMLIDRCEEIHAVSKVWRVFAPDDDGVVEVLFTIPPDPRPGFKPECQTALIYPSGHISLSDGW